jgi:phosphoglycerate dehydrogenase-like enzyme
MRGIAFEDAADKQCAWQTTIGPGLKGKTLGLLGLGRIGGQMAGYAHAFGMPVIAWSQNLTEARAKECGAKLVTKDDLFKLADVISIHLRLSARTTKLVGARELGLMKPTAYLLNSSRGPIVDEAALIDALNKGKIAGAGLDVYDEEPMPKEHPLRKAKNAVLTPHLGYVTQEALRTMYSDAVADIRAAAAGEAIRVLNQDVLKRSNLRKLR